MRIIGLAALAFILSSPLAADDNPRCRSVLQTGQSLTEQIDLLQSSYDEQKANIRTLKARNATTRLLADTAVKLERSHGRLKQAIDTAKAARCEQPDFLIEAESVANEFVQIVRVDMHAMSASKGITPLASR
jgi:phage shock protein A